MSSPPSLGQLISEWEEALGQGRELSPEALAGGRHELLREVREVIAALKRLREVAEPHIVPGTPRKMTLTLAPGGTPNVAPVQADFRAIPERAGRFEVRRLLGEGAFGRVYEAYDPWLNRPVALKVAKEGDDPQRVVRFLREARSAAALTHPNIVAVYDSGSDGGHHYIASAFVPGQALEVAITGRGAFPQSQTVEMARKLAKALAYAHRQGVVHRDVKPGNVMLREDGEPMLMDFGLAARADEEGRLTLEGQVLGTPAYMAPEQWRGQAGPRSDQYALGCLLFELLTGHPPFAGRDVAHYLALHAQAPAPPVPGAPHDLEAIVHRCLEKEPERRYPDCQELADDLARWIRGEPTRARPVSSLERAARWARREPVTAALLAAVMASLLIGAVAAWGLAAWALSEKGRADSEALRKGEEARAAVKAQKEAKANERRAQLREKQAKAAEAKANDRNHRMELATYIKELTQARREWAEGKAGRAVEILGRCSHKFRHWEHQYLWALTHGGQSTFSEYLPQGSRVAFGLDGRIITSGGWGEVIVWDAEKGIPARRTSLAVGKMRHLGSVAFSPDGKRFASWTTDWASSAHSDITLHEARSEKEVLTLKGNRCRVKSVAFSPDGNLLASGGGDHKRSEARLWDANSGECKFAFEDQSGPVCCVGFSPCGRWFASGSSRGTLRVWDAFKGKELLAVREQGDKINDLAFSPDGKFIVVGRQDGTLHVLDARNGQEWAVLRGHSGPVEGVAFSPDGRHIATCSRDTTVKLWDVPRKQEVYTFRGHTEAVTCVAFSPDGRRIASTGDDRKLKVWDVEQGREDRLSVDRGHPYAFTLAFSPDGRLIATGGLGGDLTISDVATGRVALTHNVEGGAITCLAYSPGGKCCAVGVGDNNGVVRVCDVRTGKCKFSLTGHKGRIHNIAYSPNGRHVASTGHDGTARLWDARKGNCLFTFGGGDAAPEKHEGLFRFAPDFSRLLPGAVAFSPAGRLVVGGGVFGGSVSVRDVETGKEVIALKGGTSSGGLACSLDGKFIAAGSVQEVVIWDARTGVKAATLKGHTSPVSCVAFSPDGKRLLSGDGDGTLKVWETLLWQEVLTMKAHSSLLLGAAFSPDGLRIASVGAGGVKIIGGEAQAPCLLEGHEFPVWKLAFSRDGSRLRSRALDGRRLDFETATGLPIPPDKTGIPEDVVPRYAIHRARGLVGKAIGRSIWLSRGGNNDGPNPARFTRRPGYRWHSRQADECETAGQWSAAAFHLELMHSIDPGARTRLLRALARADYSPLTQAITQNLHLTDLARVASAVGRPGLWHALSQLPSPASIHDQLGAEAARAGNWPVAERSFQSVVGGPTASSGALLNLLLAQHEVGHGDKARSTTAALARLALRQTSEKGSYVLRGWVLHTGCDPATALALSKGTGRDLAKRRNPRSLHWHGVALFRAGRFAEAEKLLSEAVTVHGKGGDEDTRLFLALALRQRGNLQRAERLISEVRAINEKRAFPYWQHRALWDLFLREAGGPPKMVPAKE